MRSLMCLLTLGVALVVTGCVSKSRAELQAREAFLAGQQQATQAMNAQKQNSVTIHGDVKNETVPWSEDLTVAKAIVAAEYQGLSDPKRIILTRNGKSTEIDPKELLKGNDYPVIPGDEIQITQ